MGVPFMPLRGVLGTDYLTVRPDFKILRNPYGDDDIVVAPAITPDVAVFHAFRADRDGNVLISAEQDNWLLAQAARTVIVTVEEVVESGNLLRNRLDGVISSIHISAIVHAPLGAHPTPCLGYYGRDSDYNKRYIDLAANDDSFRQYLAEHITGMDEETYRRRFAGRVGGGER
jgi:glutaconate CoA-transferase, subunit A